MARLNLMLLLAVLVSALYLVHTQYQSRRLFTELDRAVAEARRLDTEHQRLRVEKRAQATPLRVEKNGPRPAPHTAQPRPPITQYVSDPGQNLVAPARKAHLYRAMSRKACSTIARCWRARHRLAQ